MKPITRLALVAIALSLAGCAYRPIVDPKRSDMARYETDLAECRQIAEQAPGPGTGAAVGAAVGYGVGQVFARATGGRDREYGARGATGRGAAGAGGRGAREPGPARRECVTRSGDAALDGSARAGAQ